MRDLPDRPDTLVFALRRGGERDRLRNWDDLRVLLAVARCGSFTEAAERLALVQSTVGRRMTDLERRIGTKLFVRHGKGMQLTPRGVELVEQARQMEHAAQRIERHLVGADTALAGTIRLTCTDGFAAAWLAPRMPRFHAACPDIRVEIVTAGASIDLLDAEVDISIRYTEPVDPRLARRKVGRVRFGLFASPAYLAAAGVPHSLDDILAHQVVENVNFRRNPSLDAWQGVLIRHERLMLAANSGIAILASVRAGAGIALLPTFFREFAPELSALDIPIDAGADIWLVSHTETNRSARVRAMLDFLGAQFAQDRATGPR